MQAANFVERQQRVGQDFAEQRLGPDHTRPYTLVVGMRSWVFAPFRDLKRPETRAEIKRPEQAAR